MGLALIHKGPLDDELARLGAELASVLASTIRTYQQRAAAIADALSTPKHNGAQPNPSAATLSLRAPDGALVLLANSLAGDGETVILPAAHPDFVDYEAELAVVIGRSARRIPAGRAREVVLGYACANDVSERVIQSAEMAMGSLVVGKGYDTFCPLGPWVESDVDPGDLRIRARVNGVTKQDSRTSDLLFGVEALVAYLSTAITLLPGDVILTGTPAGVGPLVDGDTVSVSLSSIGTLTNRVVTRA